MAGSGQTAVTLYPVGNYNFGVKAPIIDKDATFEEALARMQQKCAASELLYCGYVVLQPGLCCKAAMSLLCLANCYNASGLPLSAC